MTCVEGQSGGKIWVEAEAQIGKVRRFDRDAGRTGKGILHFWTVDPTNKLGRYLGQYRAIDVEDIIHISPRRTLRTK